MIQFISVQFSSVLLHKRAERKFDQTSHKQGKRVFFSSYFCMMYVVLRLLIYLLQNALSNLNLPLLEEKRILRIKVGS